MTTLVLSALHHKPTGQGRACPFCSARWTVQYDERRIPHVWRNGLSQDDKIIDSFGNNAAIECEHANLDQKLILDFCMAFGRFEYALKRTGKFAESNINTDAVSASWDKFANAVSVPFDDEGSKDFVEASDYLLLNPPKKQVLVDGHLGWKETELNGKRSHRVLLLVRRVRNNLFHGGKFVSGPVLDSARDTLLLRSSLKVLAYCRTFHADVQAHFDDAEL